MDKNYKPVEFRDLLDGSFYFEEDSTDVNVVDDAFRRYNDAKTTRIEVKDKFLVLNMDGKLQAEKRTIYESRQAECRFCIQQYDDTSSPNDPQYRPRVGLPVVLYTIRDNVKMVVSCNNEKQICAMQKDIEEEINAPTHMTVFYLRQLSGSNRFRLESSIFENKFLGFKDVSTRLSTVTLCDGGRDADFYLSQ